LQQPPEPEETMQSAAGAEGGDGEGVPGESMTPKVSPSGVGWNFGGGMRTSVHLQGSNPGLGAVPAQAQPRGWAAPEAQPASASSTPTAPAPPAQFLFGVQPPTPAPAPAAVAAVFTPPVMTGPSPETVSVA
jgi:hypothetical protein